MKNVSTKVGSKEYACYRSGYETYNYLNDKKLLDCLNYISDIWRFDCRVRWIINLLYKDYMYDC